MRSELIEQAKLLFSGTEETENPEYLRGMVELIAYSTQGQGGLDIDGIIAEVKAEILGAV